MSPKTSCCPPRPPHAETGWDRVTLIAGLTGRRPLAPAETQRVESAGVGWLALG